MPRERNDYQRQAIDIADKCKNGNWKIYVIATEGHETEYLYFQELIKQYSIRLNGKNIHLEYVDRDKSEHSAPRWVRETLDQFYKSLVVQYNIQEYDEFWMIIDTDYYNNLKDQIQQLIELCDDKTNFKMGLSNPCFDLWLILHLVDADSQVDADSKFAKGNNPKKGKTNKKRKVKELTPLPTIREVIENKGIKGRPNVCKKLLQEIRLLQSKSMSHTEFIKSTIKDEYIIAAIERARKLGDCHPTDKDFPQRIGTMVYKLLEQFSELFEQLD